MDQGSIDPTRPHLDRFATLMNGSGEVPLDEATLTMSAILQPGLDVIEWLAALDELAATCPTPTRLGVVQHLYDQLGYTGDRSTYTDWRNSCLDRVIQSRRGIPITLSVLAIEVGRRLGVPLVGVGMPAHFLVGDPADPEWFADPFHGGQILDRSGCRELLQQLTRGQVPWREAHLSPTSSRSIIVRMTNNLKSGFVQRADAVRLALVVRMRMTMSEFSDELDEGVRSLSVLN